MVVVEALADWWVVSDGDEAFEMESSSLWNLRFVVTSAAAGILKSECMRACQREEIETWREQCRCFDTNSKGSERAALLAYKVHSPPSNAPTTFSTIDCL